MKRNHAVLAGFFAVLVPALVWAGKAERDQKARLQTTVAEQQKALMAACGCDVPIVVEWDTYKKADDMNVIGVMARNLVDAAKEQCDSKANKKALCDGVTAVHIVYEQDVMDPVLKGKTLEVHSAEGQANSDGQVSEILRKL